MRGQRISDEQRAECMAALLTGLRVTEVSRKLHLPKSTVARIKSNLKPELEQVGTESRSGLDVLLLDTLSANLTAQKRIVETASDADYLRTQSISNIAEFYETIAGQAIRLLEAASLNEQSNGSQEAPGGVVEVPD